MKTFFEREQEKWLLSTLSSLIIGKQASIGAAEAAGVTVMREKKKKPDQKNNWSLSRKILKRHGSSEMDLKPDKDLKENRMIFFLITLQISWFH